MKTYRAVVNNHPYEPHEKNRDLNTCVIEIEDGRKNVIAKTATVDWAERIAACLTVMEHMSTLELERAAADEVKITGARALQ